MTKIQLLLDPKEMDYIAQVLARQPWMEVNALMVNIQNQVQEQQRPAPEEPHLRSAA